MNLKDLSSASSPGAAWVSRGQLFVPRSVVPTVSFSRVSANVIMSEIAKMELTHLKAMASYKVLGQQIREIERNVKIHLNPIFNYCKKRGLPNLTVLVVNLTTGEPGDGSPETLSGSIYTDREKAYSHTPGLTSSCRPWRSWNHHSRFSPLGCRFSWLVLARHEITLSALTMNE